jgi:nucleoside-diphosphate-sugar epimerase
MIGGMTTTERLDGRPLGVPGPRLRRVCALTGASGYVGSRMAAQLLSAGWEVRALCRSQPGIPRGRISHVPFDLETGLAPGALEGADALVHAGYDFGHTRWRDIERVNVDGSRRLFAAAREAHIERIVCISTVAAFPGARSMYGRAKLEIERMAMDVGAAVIRPGLVWGPQGAAMFGSLRRAVHVLPLVPLVVPASLGVTLVYEDDLALFLERLLDRWPDGSKQLFVAASERMLTFGELLRSLEDGANRRYVTVPWTAAWLGLRALERLGAKPPFPSDRLLSLATTDRAPLARATGRADHYGVEFRPYALT